MSATKLSNQFGLVLNVPETAYGAGGAALDPATQGFHVSEDPVVDDDFAYDGMRGLAGATAGMLRRVAPAGRFGQCPIVHEGYLPGAAYSASVKPSFDRLLRLCGYTATLDATPGSEKWTYTPRSDGFESGYANVYSAEEVWAVVGLYVPELQLTADGPGIPRWEGQAQFLVNAVAADAAVPASIAFPGWSATAEWVRGADATLSFGAFTGAVVRRLTFSPGRVVGSRPRLGGTGHAGFSLRRYAPTLEVAIERTALSTNAGANFIEAASIDPYRVRDAATAAALAIRLGPDTQFRRMRIAAAQAQIASVEPEDDEGSSLWVINFHLGMSTPAAADDHSIVTD